MQDKHELFFIVVIMCVVVTVLLLCFIVYHLYMFLFDYTTNELIKRRNVKHHLNRKLSFMRRWQEASQEKRPFIPTPRTLKFYDDRGDMREDLTLEEINAVRQKIVN